MQEGTRREAIGENKKTKLRIWFDRALKKIVIRCPRCSLNIKVDRKEIPSSIGD